MNKKEILKKIYESKSEEIDKLIQKINKETREVLNVISDQFYDGKSKVQNGLVPMDMVLDYFNIPNYKHGETING